MKNTQLLSVVFSLIMFTGITAGTAVAYAESEDNDHDFDDRLEHFCEMTDSEKEQLFDDHPRLAQFEERLTNYCDLDEMEREEFFRLKKVVNMKKESYTQPTRETTTNVETTTAKAGGESVNMMAQYEQDEDEDIVF